MFEEFYGNYLIKAGKLDESQFTHVKDVMKSTRVKLGLIAVSEKLITEKQSDEINRLQAQMDKRFGDIAVEKGYLTDEQVGHLLSMQGNAYMQFIQAVTESGYMTLEEVEQGLLDYQMAEGFSDDDIAALKSNDIDNITSVFINSDNSFTNGLFALAVRNIIRFISGDVSMGKITTTDSYTYEHIATQKMIGDHDVFLGFAGDGISLLTVANPYAKEEFTEIDPDSYDSVCEFINCINGLYASSLSKEDVNVDMEPPLFYDNGAVKAPTIYVLPLTIAGQKVDLVSAMDNNYNIG